MIILEREDENGRERERGRERETERGREEEKGEGGKEEGVLMICTCEYGSAAALHISNQVSSSAACS